MSEITRGAVVVFQLDIPDLASVRYERDVLDLIGESIPWDRLPEGTRLLQARKTLYTIKNGAFVQGHPDLSEKSGEDAKVIPLPVKEG